MAEDSPKEYRRSPEEEIRELERKLEEKKRAFAESGVPQPEEKEIFREVLRTHIEKMRPSSPPVFPSGLSHALADDVSTKADDVKKQEEREEQIKILLEIAMTRTIEDAVRVAERAHPYLLDELHDHLVDDFYDKLVALRKIKEL